MRYKVGDKVVIKNECLHTPNVMPVDVLYRDTFMGKTVTVDQVFTSGHFTVDEDPHKYWWSEDNVDHEATLMLDVDFSKGVIDGEFSNIKFDRCPHDNDIFDELGWEEDVKIKEVTKKIARESISNIEFDDEEMTVEELLLKRIEVLEEKMEEQEKMVVELERKTRFLTGLRKDNVPKINL